MKKLFSILIALHVIGLLHAQSIPTNCACPTNRYTESKPIKSFRFANNKELVVCGYEVEADAEQPVLSEFILSACGEQDVIEFWDAQTTCRLHFAQDTLTVDELYSFPMGEDMEDEEVVWTMEKFYYDQDDQLHRHKMINHRLKSAYNAAQIESVLQAYKMADQELNEEKMGLLNQLFVSTISGSAAAKAQFSQFGKRYPALDGAYAYQYRLLNEMLTAWEQNS